MSSFSSLRSSADHELPFIYFTDNERKIQGYYQGNALDIVGFAVLNVTKYLQL